MSDNFRLIEHNVEMSIVEPRFDDDTEVYFMAEDGVTQFHMPKEKWETSKEPTNIVITVTAIVPTTEPANGVDVVASVKSTENPEFTERNPSFDKS